MSAAGRARAGGRGGGAPAPEPAPLAEFERGGAPPEILFPPEDAALWADRFGAGARGFVLAGRGEGALSWYVDGAPAERDAAGAPIWRPEAPGFYEVTAVDAAGRGTGVRAGGIGRRG